MKLEPVSIPRLGLIAFANSPKYWHDCINKLAIKPGLYTTHHFFSGMPVPRLIVFDFVEFYGVSNFGFALVFGIYNKFLIKRYLI